MTVNSIDITVIADVTCPWCVIGYRNLRQAMRRLPASVDVRLHWEGHELNPELGTNGRNLLRHAEQKYGAAPTEVQVIWERITALGARTGFPFCYTADSRTYNTHRCHLAVAWASDFGQATAFMEALFETYFIHKLNPGRHDNLLAVARRLNLDPAQLADALNDQSRSEQQRALQQRNEERGILAVPAFRIGHQPVVVGAETVTSLERALRDELTADAKAPTARQADQDGLGARS